MAPAQAIGDVDGHHNHQPWPSITATDPSHQWPSIAINGRFQCHSLLISNHHDGQQVTQTIAQGRRTRPSHQSWPSMAILAHHPCFLCHPGILRAIANHDHMMTIPPPPSTPPTTIAVGFWPSRLPPSYRKPSSVESDHHPR
ncbi:hypothetical protein D9756_005200 [Leucocoprinus leucothites]|uniref:Uncharacterized protein n=1 Tax=Leucocoprinus leucothites TaxID=201217 RepID=A0A8H5G8U4_9AGAR|nr:hypothetical protein D9756_005200 [Leucoagaricus leucothites]